MMPNARLSIRIDLGTRHKIGADKIAFLEAITTQGSISGAARSVGMSYRGAQLWVADINKAMREPAVSAVTGGPQGGGAALTPVGARLTELYRAIEARVQAAADEEIRAIQELAHPITRPARGARSTF
jgi:molybdate transport system regulatory protein